MRRKSLAAVALADDRAGIVLMSDYSRFISWYAWCRDRGGYGMTPGDCWHLGLRDYNQPFPCPNGLPIDTREPQDCEPWRNRIEKAKRDIETHKSEQRVSELAEELTDEQILSDIGAIRKWARSLQFQALRECPTGLQG